MREKIGGGISSRPANKKPAPWSPGERVGMGVVWESISPDGGCSPEQAAWPW